MSAYCRNCGALLGVGNVYCLNCGTPVALSVDEEDEGPETVVRPTPVDFDRHTVVIPDPQKVEPILHVTDDRTWFERNAKNLIALVVSLALLVALGIIFVIVLSRRPVPAPANVNISAVLTPTPTPSPSPSPSPSPTPETTTEAKCTLSSDGRPIQAHRDCDTKDCTNDPTTVARDLDEGTDVTRLSGKAIPAGGRLNYSWVPVDVDGDDLWVSSKKLSCSLVTAANTKPSPTPKKGSRSDKTQAGRPPAGAKALCHDGTYSFTRFGLAQCVFHGGVERRY